MSNHYTQIKFDSNLVYYLLSAYVNGLCLHWN